MNEVDPFNFSLCICIFPSYDAWGHHGFRVYRVTMALNMCGVATGLNMHGVATALMGIMKLL